VNSPDLRSKYLLIVELRLEAILHSNLGNENSNAGHIKCSRGPQVAHTPVLRCCCPASVTLHLSHILEQWLATFSMPCRPVARFQDLEGQNTFFRGKYFCFYHLFETMFSGQNKT